MRSYGSICLVAKWIVKVSPEVFHSFNLIGLLDLRHNYKPFWCLALMYICSCVEFFVYQRHYILSFIFYIRFLYLRLSACLCPAFETLGGFNLIYLLAKKDMSRR